MVSCCLCLKAKLKGLLVRNFRNETLQMLCYFERMKQQKKRRYHIFSRTQKIVSLELTFGLQDQVIRTVFTLVMRDNAIKMTHAWGANAYANHKSENCHTNADDKVMRKVWSKKLQTVLKAQCQFAHDLRGSFSHIWVI